MAQTKNTKNTGKTSEKKTSSVKNTKSRAAASDKNAAQRKKNETAEASIISQLTPYILAVFALLSAACVIVGEGQVGGGVRGILTGLFGGAAYALPVFILVRALIWNRDAREGRVTSRSASMTIVFLMLTMLLHITAGGQNTLDVKTHYAEGNILSGGGVFGGVLGELLMKGFGKVCSLIIIIAVILILALYIWGMTPRGLFILIAYKIKFANEKRAERIERRKNAPPTKNKIKEAEYLEYLREKKKRERMNSADDSVYNIPTVREVPVDEVGAQIPIPRPEATVYHIKKKRMLDVDIPVDDIGGAKQTAEIEANEGTLSETADRVLDSETADSGAIDEKIFDEVMKRTRERIEKSRLAEEAKDDKMSSAFGEENFNFAETSKTEDISDNANAECTESKKEKQQNDFIENESISETEIKADGDVIDAVEVAARSISEKKGKTTQAELTTDSVKLAASAVGTNEDFDVSKIFVNPEDAELLDKLSSAYMQPQTTMNVTREQISSPTLQKEVRGKAPIPEYKFPPIDILTEDRGGGNENIKEELQDNAVKLVETLKSFNVRTKIENISRGPTITRYELLPEPGVRVRSIVNLVDDIALNLATTGVRIEAPIPGKSAVGIEVPNKKQATVHLRTLIESDKFRNAKSKLTVCLGEDVAGEAVYFDIAKMPHLLIAGATGMGKSVCINSLITSILYKASPNDVKLILVDPKKVELSIYNGIPHLLVPVVSEPKKAAGSLSWAVGEMERRFGLIEAVGVRDIRMFNEVTKNDPDYEYMPQIVIIIDELADLMMTAPDDVEESICRLAQKARAAGMHLIIGTQRPSVDVITGLIKANIPSRIAFTVASQIDSRTIIDRGGAENLIGRGDMLFNPVGAQKPIRVQGAYVSESDVEEVVGYIKNINSQIDNTYSEEIVNQIEREAQKCGNGKKGGGGGAVSTEDGEDEDPMLKSAIELAVESGKISTSLIQRRLSLGYGRAAKLIDRMEQLGYVSAPDGQKPREVLISKQDYMEMRLHDEAPFDL